MARGRRSVAPRLAAVAVGLVLALAAGEALLALLDLPRFRAAHSVPTQFLFPAAAADGGPMLYTNAPSARIPFSYDGDPRGYFGPGATIEHPTNSLGFRGPEFAARKPADALRIAFVGDSFTFGEGVRFEDTFPERAAAALTRRCGTPVESLNFGVGGFNTTLERLLLERRVLGFEPDVVVLGYVLNDAEPPQFRRVASGIARLERAELAKGAAEARPPAGGVWRLRLARWVWKALAGRARTERTIAWYRALFAPDEPGWVESRQALLEMAELCRRADVRFVVLCFPILVELDGDYPFAAIHAQVGRVAEDAGALFVDLLPTFRGSSAPELWVHPTDQHPNDRAHALAAERLVEALIASGTPPCAR
jgi:hypothetical protein